MKRLITLATVSLVMGCAIPDAPTRASAGPVSTDDRFVCSNEAPTGNLIQVTKCRRVVDIDAKTRQDRETMENIKPALPEVR